MATKSPKPAQPPGEPLKSKSPAQLLQARTEAPPPGDELLAITLRTDTTFEYHVTLARSAINAILDPDVPDTFIEVPCNLQGMKRFLHTAYVKEIDVRGYE